MFPKPNKHVDKPVDVLFVLDATSSTQCIFEAMIQHTESIIYDINFKFRRASVYSGAVIYRDPVDYRPPPPETPLDPISQREIDEAKEEFNKQRIQRLKEKGIYSEEEELRKIERRKHFDNVKYPEDINVAIDLIPDIEKFVNELAKIECKAGHDEPEDWAGALDMALNDISWRDRSKKLIVWIADSNAHGRRFCGFNNHNSEENRFVKLISEMARSEIYFIGVNVMKNDEGCQRTLNEMKKIYESNGGKSFIINRLKVNIDSDMEEDDIPPGFLDDFHATIQNTIANSFPLDFF